MNFLDKHPSENRMEFTKLKVAANMRVLGGVVYIVDLQCVVKFCFAKRTFLLSRNSFSEQFWAAFCNIGAVICIESWWVGSHIKLRYELNQNVTEVRTQFDMAVNPLWFNINLRTMALACQNGWSVLVPECHFQKCLFFMNYFYKTRSLWILTNSETEKERRNFG